MKRKWKILITRSSVLLIAAVGVYASTVYSKRGVVTVQTGKVVQQDLTSLVTASGEIKPKNYINIGANAIGSITELLVKEGDRVRKGQLLAKIENVQPEADVQAQKANISSAEADSTAAEAGLKASDENINTMQASIEQGQSRPRPHEVRPRPRRVPLQRAADGQAGFRDRESTPTRPRWRRFTQSETRLVQARAQREQSRRAARLLPAPDHDGER